MSAATVLRKPKLADTFARHGKALAADQWDAVLARAARPEPTTETEADAPAPKAKARKTRG